MISKPFLFLLCQAPQPGFSLTTMIFSWIVFLPGCSYFWGRDKGIHQDHRSNCQQSVMVSRSKGQGVCPGTLCTGMVIFYSSSAFLRSLSNNSRTFPCPFYHTLEQSWDLCNGRVLFCGNNNLISICVGGQIISYGLGAQLQDQGGTGLNSCMINTPLNFYERKVCCKDYRFRLGMSHPKVVQVVEAGSCGESRNNPPPPSAQYTHSGKEKYVMYSEDFNPFF